LVAGNGEGPVPLLDVAAMDAQPLDLHLRDPPVMGPKLDPPARADLEPTMHAQRIEGVGAFPAVAMRDAVAAKRRSDAVATRRDHERPWPFGLTRGRDIAGRNGEDHRRRYRNPPHQAHYVRPYLSIT
jgi:hypothetical protein